MVNREGVVVDHNQKFLEMWRIPQDIGSPGTSNRALLEHSMDQVVDPETFYKKVRELYLDLEKTDSDMIALKDGRVFERYSQPQRINGMPIGRVWSFRDVTARKRAEKERDDYLRYMVDLLAIVSHDLKNPLMAIQMGVSFLERCSSKEMPSPEERALIKKQLQQIKNSSTRMDHLIHDLLIATRIEAGHLPLTRKSHDLSLILSEVLEMMKPIAEQKGISFQWGPSEFHEAARHVTCDRERIFQVFSNLIGNAIKFSPKEQKIILQIENAGTGVTFSVRDFGPGIAKDFLAHVFERCWQAHSARSIGSGTGLGLYIAKGIVEAHGGKIWVESFEGDGSTFYFTLPKLSISKEDPIGANGFQVA